MGTSPSLGIAFVAFLIAPAGAQTPTASHRPQPKAHAIHVVVRDVSGTPLEDVGIAIAGPTGGETATDAQGAAAVTLSDGSYRLRLEHDGFITLERDVTIKNGQPAEVEIALNRAPTPPTPEAPPPPPPAPAPPPPPAAAAEGPPVNVSLPAFLERNFVGREPLKESILSCTPDATIRLLQLREPIAAHTHAAADEVLYVVAGEGAARIGDASTAITPGSISVIPRGTPHAIERRGKNPLIVLSTIVGEPCSVKSSGPDR